MCLLVEIQVPFNHRRAPAGFEALQLREGEITQLFFVKLYKAVEKIAPEIICEQRKIYKGVCPNVDFLSGFVYRMLGIPDELFTPIFAIARVTGWSAHRMEELANMTKIIRPAFKSIMDERPYPDTSVR